MTKRLFLAINLPGSEKKKISEALEKIKPNFDSAVKFLKPENWHVTLIFLSYQNDLKLVPISNVCRKIASTFKSKKIELNKMIYGPKERARMIWLINKENKDCGFEGLVKNLNENLAAEGVKFKVERRPFLCHLTLARGNGSIDKKVELPQIKINFEARSLDLMESELKRSGAEYNIISGFDFSNEI